MTPDPTDLEAQCAAMRSVLQDIRDSLGETLTASLLYARIVNVLKDGGGREMLERELELKGWYLPKEVKRCSQTTNSGPR